jgi:hypothetical protein
MDISLDLDHKQAMNTLSIYCAVFILEISKSKNGKIRLTQETIQVIYIFFSK